MKYIKLVLLLGLVVIMSGCAKIVTVPLPTDMTSTVQVIANSNIAPEMKPIMIEKVIDNNREMYRMAIERADRQGTNFKDAFMQAIQITASIVALAFGVSK